MYIYNYEDTKLSSLVCKVSVSVSVSALYCLPIPLFTYTLCIVTSQWCVNLYQQCTACLYLFLPIPCV